MPPECNYRQPADPDLNFDYCRDIFYNTRPVVTKNYGTHCIQVTDQNIEIWNEYSSHETTILDLPQSIMKSIQEYLIGINILKCWIPARGLGNDRRMRWVVPSRYGELVPMRQFTDPLNLNNGCLLLNLVIGTNIGQVTNCTEAYPMLRIYNNIIGIQPVGVCPYSSVYLTYFNFETMEQVASCFHLQKSEMNEMSNSIMIVNSAQKTNIFRQLALGRMNSTDMCAFYPLKGQSDLISKSKWQELSNYSEFVNWNFHWGLVKDDSNSLLLIDSGGKWGFENRYTCRMCEQRIDGTITPRISLFWDTLKNRVEIYVQNENFLWQGKVDRFRCFSEINDTMTKVNTMYDSKSHYYIRLLPAVTNNTYVCNGFSIFRPQRIESNRVINVKYLQPDRFAVLVRSGLCLNCTFKYYKETFASIFANPLGLDDLHVISVHPTYARYSIILFHFDIIIDPNYKNCEKNNLNMTDPDLLRIYNSQKLLENRLKMFTKTGTSIITLNSTEYCLPESISSNAPVNWLPAKIGEISESIEKCVCDTGLGAFRKCEGDKVLGGIWQRVAPESNCEPVSGHTEQLIQMYESFEMASQTSDILQDLAELVTTQNIDWLPIDIYHISKIMEKVDIFNTSLNISDAENLYLIYNQLMLIEKSTFQVSALVNSTNSLLVTWDNLMNDLNWISVSNEGISLIKTQNIFTLVTYPELTNVTGIALFSTDSFSSSAAPNLNAYSVNLLYKNQSTHTLLKSPYLEIGAYVSDNLLQSFNGAVRKIIINVFNNDKLFQVYIKSRLIQPVKAESKVISISMPDVDTHHLPTPISTFFKTRTAFSFATIHNLCGFWNYENNTGWSQLGQYLVAATFYGNIECVSTHLTHFSNLIYVGLPIPKHDERALDIISIIGCTLSLLGTAGIYLTAIVFPVWRTKMSTKFLLNFTTAISFQLILFGFVPTELSKGYSDYEYTQCIILGALHHYALLVVFIWTLIIAYLQFIRYVIVFEQIGHRNLLLHSSIAGWALPLVPVVIVLIVDANMYTPDLKTTFTHICYPRSYALYFALLLPIGIIISINLLIFLTVLYNVLFSAKLVTAYGASERKATLDRVRLSIFQFFLLGLTWFFGFLASASHVGIVFSYLFCMTATIQGLILFIYFVLMDPVARKLWLVLFRKFRENLQKTVSRWSKNIYSK